MGKTEIQLDDLIAKIENILSGNLGRFSENEAFLCICLEIKKIQQKLRDYDQNIKV